MYMPDAVWWLRLGPLSHDDSTKHASLSHFMLRSVNLARHYRVTFLQRVAKAGGEAENAIRSTREGKNIAFLITIPMS